MKAFSEDTAKRLENFGFIQFRPGGNLLSSSIFMFSAYAGLYFCSLLVLFGHCHVVETIGQTGWARVETLSKSKQRLRASSLY